VRVTSLGDFARTIKSANAGASWLTFDVGFNSTEEYRWVVESGALAADVFGKLFGVNPDDVLIYCYDPADTVKVTIPRAQISGGLGETDFDGVQQFAPLLDIPIPLPPGLGRVRRRLIR
jgi:Domain of unknown function (DUF4387)